jgi:hypothetical protein
MEARVQKNHKQFLCTKYNWDSTIFADIAWEAHRRALNQLTHKKTILIKYLNGIVPVGKVVNRYDKKYAINCPSCESSTCMPKSQKRGVETKSTETHQDNNGKI